MPEDMLERPEIQDYSGLAKDYDKFRYISPVDVLKEGYRERALKDLLPPAPPRALDVACGTGRGLAILEQVSRNAVGVDGTLEMLWDARKKIDRAGGRARVCQGNASLLPFAAGTFDLVTCLNFFHLFPFDAKVVFAREIGRVLKPGGVAVIEFDNALQGVAVGALRKYFGKDIGYDWPWVALRCFPADLFTVTAARGVNVPGIWRFPQLRFVEQLAARFPVNYLSNRLLIRAVRR